MYDGNCDEDVGERIVTCNRFNGDIKRITGKISTELKIHILISYTNLLDSTDSTVRSGC
jgi:hypothetical protein